MLQQEFEKLAGRKVDAREFERINGVYLATTLEKIRFVELYEHDKESLLMSLSSDINAVDTALGVALAETNKLLELIVSTGNADIIQQATELCGLPRVVKSKLRTASELTEEERQFLIDKFY